MNIINKVIKNIEYIIEMSISIVRFNFFENNFVRFMNIWNVIRLGFCVCLNNCIVLFDNWIVELKIYIYVYM